MTPSTSSTKIKYINNRELLSEIHNSKKSFCSFIEPEHANFDTIVHNVSQITPELIEAVREKKAKPRGKPAIPLDEIPPESIVVRVMTYEHIPLDPDRVRKSRVTDQSYARTSFPPFKHYILSADGPKEVLRSHWEGGFENGHFVADNGRINNRLAMMFMLLVERYSRRGNWRGYCVDEETEALTQRGWLKHNQITEKDTILSYENGKMKWSKIKSIFRDDYDGNMFKLTVTGLDALVTPQHKFLTDSGLKQVDYLCEKDKLILMGEAVETSDNQIYNDKFVELVGWAVTEGNYHKSAERNYTRISIYQNEGDYADRIRNCLNSLGAKFSEFKKDGSDNIRFLLTKDISTRIQEVAENRILSMPFILSLTQKQRQLLIDTMIDGDGSRTQQGVTLKISYVQKCSKHVDAFTALCTLAGHKVSIKKRDTISYGKSTSIHTVNFFSNRRKVARVENIEMYGAKRGGKVKGRGKINHPNEPTVYYKGKVWCPETEFGSFVARRNGSIYISGNSYVDEMRSQALLQLSQIGLQFDESKSDNPFAFYTTAIRNCFTRVLNLEKKAQNIRDDMIIIAGASPSYTRQIDNELEYRFPSEKSSDGPKRKAGAPKKSNAVVVSSDILD